MLSIWVCLCSLFFLFAESFDPYTRYSQLNLPIGPFGPDSVALDRFDQGPYVGVSDGRILKYNGASFVDFAYLTPNRTKQLCDGVKDINLGPTCGRPLGFSFDLTTGDLYVVDAYGGLYKVGPKGGQATLLANNASGVLFNFLNGVDYDPIRKVVYFSDASLKFNFRDTLEGNPSPPGDSSGRLLEYDTITGQVKVLLEGLPRPAGAAVSVDGTFVLFSSFATQQVFKYWVVGPKARKTEVLLNLPGFPVKVKKASSFGTFWVAVNVVVQQQPRILNPYGYKFVSNGDILLIKNLTQQYPNIQVNVLQEYDTNGGELFIGSRIVSYVGIYKKW